jgi:trigger factor
MAIIDIEEIKEGVSVNKYQGQQYMVTQDSVLPFPGFAEQIVGMAKDEEKEFSLSYPDDYPIKELKGKEYNFKVKVTEVKEKHLPDLNDEFAKIIGEDLETLDALKENIATSLRNIAEEKAKRDFEQKVIEAAVDLAKVEYPPILVEQEINRFLNERERMLANQGGLESYLKNINKTEEEVKEEIRPEATKQLIQSLVLAKISDDEKVEVNATEIDSEIEGMLKNTGEDEDRMRELFGTPQGRQWIKERLTIQKTVQLLSEIAIGNSTKVEVEE